VVSFTLRPFYPQGKNPWYPLDRRLGGFQNGSGRDGEEKNTQLLPGLEPQIIKPETQRYTTDLTWLPINILKFSQSSVNYPSTPPNFRIKMKDIRNKKY
jgi:hypothetical protein